MPGTNSLMAFFALLVAFCCALVRAQADPRLEEDLFLRSLLLRQYLDQPSVSLDRIEQEIPVAVNFWRQRRTPSERAKLFRLSDQYTPTPCRWKLCASIFKGNFR